MIHQNSQQDDAITIADQPSKNFTRKKFISRVGLLSLMPLAVVSACKKTDKNVGVNLGSGDIGILNYAYALEQLEAAFYTRVVANPYASMSAAETSLLKDIRDHEIAHREFFKAAIGGDAIGALDVNFSTIDFTSRTSVLATAKAFEDLGVTAYNGAGQLLMNANYLLLAGKIVSVEARHAAIIRDLITPGSFSDNTAVDANALDGARLPAEVLLIASTYINTKIDASNLPS